MTTPSWPQLLDAFEARLDAQAAALDAGATAPVPGFEPPVDVPPIPEHLRDRAEALVRRCRTIEDDLRSALDSTGAGLAGVDAERAAKRHTQPLYFDSRI